MKTLEPIGPEIIEYAAQICASFDTFKKLGGYSNIRIDRLTVIGN